MVGPKHWNHSHVCLKVWIIFLSHTIPLSAYGRLVWLVPSLPVLPAVPTFVPKAPSEANLKMLLLVSMNLLVCRPLSSASSYSLSLISQCIAHGDAFIFHLSQARKPKEPTIPQSMLSYSSPPTLSSLISCLSHPTTPSQIPSHFSVPLPSSAPSLQCHF